MLAFNLRELLLTYIGPASNADCNREAVLEKARRVAGGGPAGSTGCYERL